MIRVLASIICAGLPLLAQSGLKDQVSQDFLHFRSALGQDALEKAKPSFNLRILMAPHELR